ncbi:hypothetical protein LSCM4_07947 [Leishmania orientalis]|uniref:EF-hand domain-containing protein n=1 Tax=Leishmania orientalis TaxID=2249476 RepID=A0A836HHS5_9TRYP|nr:hypothetical protein LSCM4_07947 [Leishmania orientalis]
MESLSEVEQRELKEMFDLIDIDHSGFISLQELRKLMTALHLKPTEQELEEVFEETRSVPSIANASGRSGSPLPVPLATTSVSAAANDGSGTSSPSSTISGPSRAMVENGTFNSLPSVAAVSAAPAGTVTFAQFAAMMARRVQSEYTDKQLRSAFQLFESPDMPEGFVSTSVLAHALATYGSQKLERKEIDRLMAAVDPKNTGRLNYYEFVDLLTG